MLPLEKIITPLCYYYFSISIVKKLEFRANTTFLANIFILLKENAIMTFLFVEVVNFVLKSKTRGGNNSNSNPGLFKNL